MSDENEEERSEKRKREGEKEDDETVRVRRCECFWFLWRPSKFSVKGRSGELWWSFLAGSFGEA